MASQDEEQGQRGAREPQAQPRHLLCSRVCACGALMNKAVPLGWLSLGGPVEPPLPPAPLLSPGLLRLLWETAWDSFIWSHHLIS